MHITLYKRNGQTNVSRFITQMYYEMQGATRGQMCKIWVN